MEERIPSILVLLISISFFLVDSIKGELKEIYVYDVGVLDNQYISIYFIFLHFSMPFGNPIIICVISSDIMTILRMFCLESHFTGDLLKYERQRYDGW